MFQEKCVNLEQALESANVVSTDEIKALRREVTQFQDRNDQLTQTFDKLKQEHESMLFTKDSEIERLNREHFKQMKAIDQTCNNLETKVQELQRRIMELEKELSERSRHIAGLDALQNESEIAADRSIDQMNQLKALNLQSVDKCEDLKSQLVKLTKMHAQELTDKLAKARQRSEDVDAEI